MSVLETKLNARSADFQANAAAMRAVVDDLRVQVAKAAEGGGEAARAKHMARGKLPPRERVAMLLDPGTPFLELAPLAAHGMYLNKDGVGDAPCAGVIAGTANFDDSVVAAVRDPGGAWSAPLPVAAREGWEPMGVEADVSARGDVVVWTDVDMTYPNDEIPRIVKELDGFDHVVGARRTEEGTLRFARVPAKWFIRKLASYLTDTDIKDLNSGLRAFRRDVAMQYVHHLPAGFSCVTTLTMSFLSNGYSVKYVPIDYFPRAGTSKFHWWKDTKRYLLQVVRMTLSYNPLKVFMPVGVLLLVLGLAKLGIDWSQRDFRLAANTLLIFLAALQAITVGLLADLIVRATKPAEQVPPS